MAVVALPQKFTMASPYQYSLFWSWNEEKFPCNCCPPSVAVDFGVWTCLNTEREWYIVDDTPMWADLVESEIAVKRAAETPAEKAARLASEKLQEEEIVLTSEAAKMASYAATQKIVNTTSVGKGSGKKTLLNKVACPCKWLYCDEKAPKSQWRKNENGEWCAPVLRRLTGSECWAHEYTDPKKFAAELRRLKALGQSEAAATATAKRFAHTIKHSCKFLHPGEDGWLAQWETDRTYKPVEAVSGGAANGTPAIANRWAALGGR